MPPKLRSILTRSSPESSRWPIVSPKVAFHGWLRWSRSAASSVFAIHEGKVDFSVLRSVSVEDDSSDGELLRDEVGAIEGRLEVSVRSRRAEFV